jgi:tetratricopeptide (TPR) repeat protein
VASLTGQWHEAERQWRDALTRNRADPIALGGQVRALIRLGRHEDAAVSLETLKKAWPKLPAPYLLSAELAAARGDLQSAVELSRQAAVLFPTSRDALRDFGHYLLRSGRLAEAERVAEQLSAFEPYAGLILRGQILAARHPDADHTDFWLSAQSRHPEAAELTRRVLHAALGAAREGDALWALDYLLTHHNPRLSDANYLIGIINLLGGRETAIRGVLRGYLKRLRGRPEYRLALIRLSRQLFSNFCSRRSRQASSHHTVDTWSRTLMNRSSLPDGPRQLLGRALALQENLRQHKQITFLDTDVSASEARAFIATVGEKVARKEAFSFVRLGDGEANCLPYEAELQAYASVDADEREEIWWGAPISPEQRTTLARRVLASIRRSDCVGIPTVSRFLRDLALDRDDALTRTRSGRGLRAVLWAAERGYLEDEKTPKARSYASAHLHQDLERWNLYGELFDGVGEIVCVTCHPDLPDVLHSLFGVRTARSLLIPPRSATARLMRKRTTDSRTLPAMVEEVIDTMETVVANRLVVVGAGYLGKWIADEARGQGGVALDLGSMLDYWIGLKTRSYLDL